MSQFRKDEIARNTARINDTLATVRQMMDASNDTVDPQIAAIILPTLSALFGLIAGMANDLNEINERLATGSAKERVHMPQSPHEAG